MKHLWLVLLFFASACAKPMGGPLVPIATDPDVVVSLARIRPMPSSLQARFSVNIDLGEKNYTVPAALLLDQPDRFRFELYTPFGTPLATIASDGQAINVWSQRDKTFYEGPDASAVLERFTGGKIGIDDLLGIFTGALPMADAEVLSVGRTVFERGGVAIVMLGPDDIRVRAVIDPRTGMVRRLRVDPPLGDDSESSNDDEPLLEVRYEGVVRQEKTVLPSRIEVLLPRVDWALDIEVKKWKVLDEAPAAFELKAPPRAAVRDLRSALEEMRP